MLGLQVLGILLLIVLWFGLPRVCGPILVGIIIGYWWIFGPMALIGLIFDIAIYNINK